MKATIEKTEFTKKWNYNNQVRIYCETWQKIRYYEIQKKNEKGTWDTVECKWSLKEAKEAAAWILEDIEMDKKRFA